MLRLSDLPNYVRDSTPKNITFVSIGGNHNGREAKYEDNHQFPPFLQDIYTSSRSVTFRIILIDPSDHPPWLHPNEIFQDSDIYKNIKLSNRIEIINVQERVDVSEKDLFVDLIDGFKSNLNNVDNFLVNEQIVQMNLMFVHAFSGASLTTLKSKLTSHYGHITDFFSNILIDVCCSGEYGCFLDMTTIFCRPVIKLINNRYVIEDYDRCTNDHLRHCSHELLTLHERVHIKMIVQKRLRYFFANQLTLYRQITLCDFDILERVRNNLDVCIDASFDIINEIMDIDLNDVQKLQSRIDILLQKTRSEFIKQIEDILRLSLDPIKHRAEIMAALTIDDCYKRTTCIKSVLDRIIFFYE